MFKDAFRSQRETVTNDIRPAAPQTADQRFSNLSEQADRAYGTNAVDPVVLNRVLMRQATQLAKHKGPMVA